MTWNDLSSVFGGADTGELDPENDDATGIRGMAPPDSDWGSEGIAGPADPVVPSLTPDETPVRQPIGAAGVMQPVDDEQPGLPDERPPAALEEALDDAVDPYALWTDDHVDVPDMDTSELEPADSNLIDPPGFAGGEPDGGLESSGFDDGADELDPD